MDDTDREKTSLQFNKGVYLNSIWPYNFLLEKQRRDWMCEKEKLREELKVELYDKLYNQLYNQLYKQLYDELYKNIQKCCYISAENLIVSQEWENIENTVFVEECAE